MPERDASIIGAGKATLLRGAVFLIPAFLAFFVFAKVFGMLRSVAASLGERLGVEGALAGMLLDLAAIAVVLLICFLAGLIARRATAQRVRTKVDELLLNTFPGYAFVKGLAENIHDSEQIATSFVPVVVSFGDYWQVAFETSRMPGGIVSIYLPGAPNPWSGSVVLATAEQVRKLPVSVSEALKLIRTLGRGSEELAAEVRSLARPTARVT
jgi:uncharacterized membrane protein